MNVARTFLLCLGLLGSAAAGEANECLQLLDEPRPETRVRVGVTAGGTSHLAGKPLAFLQVRRAAEGLLPENIVVRLLPSPGRVTIFTFARPGQYFLRLRAADEYRWPEESQQGEPVDGCPEQAITITAEKLPPFHGTRTHAWIAVRPWTRLETAASIYTGRLGFAGVFEFAPGERENPNSWNVGADVRWRGARGYLGGGARYFPDEQAGLFRVRPVVVAGEELPAFRKHPTWFLLDVRLERRPEWAFWRSLRGSFGVRIDLTRDKP